MSGVYGGLNFPHFSVNIANVIMKGCCKTENILLILIKISIPSPKNLEIPYRDVLF